MVDQNSQFYAILTKVGAAKQANADALGIPWKITHMAVGDASPAGLDNPPLPMPDASWTSLLNEWRRAPLNQLKVDEKDSAVIVAEQVIPAEIGGRWIREVGLYDADGDLVAVANCAPTYKPLLNQGSGRTQVVRMNLVVSSASNVQLKIDPGVVLATREFVTEELAKRDFKHSVLAATTAAITLSGLQTMDGVALQSGARVLVKNQAAAKDNGLYLVASGAWTRCPDADSSAKVTPGLLVLVERGTVNGDSGWQLVTDAPITLGVTALAFDMAFGSTGVVPGTYRSVSVDKYGRIVAATNPTTVAGYGLIDVLTTTQVNAALALKAPLASPALTGAPTAPTLAGTDTSTKLANAASVRAIMANFGLGSKAASFEGSIDDIRETGVYLIANTSLGAKPPYPPGFGSGTVPNGTLFHLERGSSNMSTQLWDTLTAGTPMAFLRTRLATGVWGEWSQLWNSVNTPKQSSPLDVTPGAMLTIGSFGVGKAVIGVDPNLNSYQVPGNYLTALSALTNVPPGWPTAARYSLIVEGYDSTNYLVQTLTALSVADAPISAKRVMTGPGNWTSWQVLSTNEQLPYRGIKVFSTAGTFTWTVPKGVTKAWVRVVGGGGGGGRFIHGGGGGGGGGIAEALVDLTGLSSVSVTVGRGGAGRTTSNGDGDNGSGSSFGTLLSADPGRGSSIWLGGRGGAGVGGDINASMGNGHNQTRHDNSGNGGSIYGGGSGAGGGGVGSGYGIVGGAGGNGVLPGSGGGGGNENGNGGNGAAGEVSIRW